MNETPTGPINEPDVELRDRFKQTLKQNLETFVSGDFTRAITVNEQSPEWREIIESAEFIELIVEVANEALQQVRLHEIFRIITYLADSSDGFNSFERPELQELRKSIATYLVTVIDNLIANNSFTHTQIFPDSELGRLIYYIVSMKIYLPLEGDNLQIIEELRKLAEG